MLPARLLLAAFFLDVGVRKFLPLGTGLLIFDQLNAPHWFRHLNGILQIAGAMLLLLSRTVLVGNLFFRFNLACAPRSRFFLP